MWLLSGSDENVLELVVMAAPPYEYTKITELYALKGSSL